MSAEGLYVLNIEPVSKGLADRIAEALEETLVPAPQAVALDTDHKSGQWRVQAYYRGISESNRIQELLEAIGLGKMIPHDPLPVQSRDWVAASLKGLKPVRAGRFLIHGSHDRGCAHANEIAIEIDANQAFGTGHHETTVGCLVLIWELARRRRFTRALDVGTGTGILAIAIARLLKIPVIASDIDPVAVAIASENAAQNAVSPWVRTLNAAGLRSPAIQVSRPFDLITANILAKPLVSLAPDVARALGPGGIAIVSGLLATPSDAVRKAYRDAGLKEVASMANGDWTTLAFRKPASTKR